MVRKKSGSQKVFAMHADNGLNAWRPEKSPGCEKVFINASADCDFKCPAQHLDRDDGTESFLLDTGCIGGFLGREEGSNLVV